MAPSAPPMTSPRFTPPDWEIETVIAWKLELEHPYRNTSPPARTLEAIEPLAPVPLATTDVGEEHALGVGAVLTR